MTISSADILPADLKVFLNHVYEFKKGVRQMVLYTVNRKYEEFATARLRNQKIEYLIQPVDKNKINLFFGRPECIHAIRCMVTRPLNQLTPEEDFILGAMLGYDICAQCERYCARKNKSMTSA
ncbi:DUF2023 domain-containing protein [Bacteroides heparinolyticus]|uniref:DUF2023 family protein n=3 Tax=Bacteroides TaxID=816 RepID=A0A2R3MPE4_9BACE|nr:DUF2023 domain-containing protein [Bacteroides zoogleoformans]AVM56766.1 DUF2023 domain-containing protein [Bacteroides heparinolyticus]RRD88394.1 DUF2023 family protein [Bacteroides heparinolyticus]TCO89976.1 uncharacterized protein DUF2023 [Bacteroides heparinolyticus]TWJ11399.1 uncharacterized protein DUF2023 [Bacteroides zoogleoformans]